MKSISRVKIYQHPASSIQHPASSIQHPASSIQDTRPCERQLHKPLASAISIFALLAVFLFQLSGCGGSSGGLPATAVLQSIAVSSAKQSIPIDGAAQYSAIATYGGGTTVDVTSTATWASTSPTVAGISSTGIVSGLAAGTSSITATFGAITGTGSVTVTTVTLQKITVTPSNPNIVPGQTRQLTATRTYSDGSTADITSLVTWASTTPSIATVNSTGLATGVSSGTSIFTASKGIVSGSTVPALTVESEVNDLTVTANPLTPTVTLTGQLSSNTDMDYYQVTAGGPGAISVAFAGAATAYNGWNMVIMNSASTVLASANIVSLFASTQTVSAGVASAGTYYVLVQAPAGTTATNNSTENYTLTVTGP